MKAKIVNAVKLGLVLLLVYLGTRQVYRYIALQNSDVIVRIAYRGLENLFHAPYEYYAVSLRSSCKIPKSMIKKRFGEEVEKLEIYDDIDTKYWLVMLTYSENGFDYLEGNPPCLLTAFGDEYRVSYSSRSGDGKEPSIDHLNVMVKAAEKLYERDPTKRMSWQGTPYDVLYFILIQHGEEYLIANNVADSLHRIQKNGDIVKVMDLPEKGEFDYYYFYGSEQIVSTVNYFICMNNAVVENMAFMAQMLEKAGPGFSSWKQVLMDLMQNATLKDFMKGVQSAVCALTGDPVNANTGNFIYDKEDIYIKGTMPIFFKRTYNRIDTRTGCMGTGWRHNYEIELLVENDRYVRVVSETQ